MGRGGGDDRWRGNDGEGRNDRVTVTNTPVLTQGERREMIRAQLVGATGYGGLGMVELLVRHPEIESGVAAGEERRGTAHQCLFPAPDADSVTCPLRRPRRNGSVGTLTW